MFDPSNCATLWLVWGFIAQKYFAFKKYLEIKNTRWFAFKNILTFIRGTFPQKSGIPPLPKNKRRWSFSPMRLNNTSALWTANTPLSTHMLTEPVFLVKTHALSMKRIVLDDVHTFMSQVFAFYKKRADVRCRWWAVWLYNADV